MPASHLPKLDRFAIYHSIFPLLPLRRAEATGARVYADPWELGSVFFISKLGLFLTAKHVVGKYSTESYAVIAINREQRVRKNCPVVALERHPDLDVAIGVSELPSEDGWGFPWALGTGRLGMGARVMTYGYSKTKVSEFGEPEDRRLGLGFEPRVHLAKVESHEEGHHMAGGPCYLLDRDPGNGVSGAPLVRVRTNCAHAIVSTGMTPTEGAPFSVALDVAAFVDDWQVDLLGGRTIRDLAATGVVVIR